jgi:hypothetical protein
MPAIPRNPIDSAAIARRLERLSPTEDGILNDLLYDTGYLIGETAKLGLPVQAVLEIFTLGTGWTLVSYAGRRFFFSPTSWGLFLLKLVGLVGTARAIALIADGRAIGQNGLPTVDFAASATLGALGTAAIVHAGLHYTRSWTPVVQATIPRAVRFARGNLSLAADALRDAVNPPGSRYRSPAGRPPYIQAPPPPEPAFVNTRTGRAPPATGNQPRALRRGVTYNRPDLVSGGARRPLLNPARALAEYVAPPPPPPPPINQVIRPRPVVGPSYGGVSPTMAFRADLEFARDAGVPLGARTPVVLAGDIATPGPAARRFAATYLRVGANIIGRGAADAGRAFLEYSGPLAAVADVAQASMATAVQQQEEGERLETVLQGWRSQAIGLALNSRDRSIADPQAREVARLTDYLASLNDPGIFTRAGRFGPRPPQVGAAIERIQQILSQLATIQR